MTGGEGGEGVGGAGRIVLTGATGTVGSALLHALAALGHRPTALVRPGRAAAVADLADPVEVDLEEEGGSGGTGALVGALARTRGLFLLSPFHPRQDLWQRRLVDAAADAGVEHVVRLSALGADPESPVLIHRQHGLAERALAERGLPYTVLRPNAFMQNATQWLATIAARDAVVLPAGQARVSMIDVRDIASAAAAVLTGPPGTGAMYDLTGPRALGYATVAAELSAAAGREIRYQAVSPAEAAEVMLGAGVPEWAVRARLQLYETYVAGEAEDVTASVALLTGQAPRDFAALAAELSDRLRGTGLSATRGER
ncbi:NmrA family NAD(P)-binding protein [Streptomyces sp. SID3212]|uniref:NmrA family NAD(P)-binding protein n=1 Tax=Streptomyces sp. SID3212 TaxID=2690259 RepID=UPI0013701350|nr:NmrA family NAD(P)-binding protein [Streptomyces sp. SID3212]MYV57867.1 NmrA family NAD(P)-binding protein [Streptomyces sp. SID3212]